MPFAIIAFIISLAIVGLEAWTWWLNYSVPM